MNYKIDFDSRGHLFDKDDCEYISKCLQTMTTFTQGPYQDEFEQEFSNKIEIDHSFAVSNCTAALELAAILCDIKEEDEIIIPSHTFCATAIPFARTKGKIVWCDIDPDTFVISLDTIKKCLTLKTKVIVCVHLYGMPCPMNEIMDFVKDKNILVVEDCAQAPFAEIGHKYVGSFGDFATFSFHTHKNMTTLGEGGMLIVKDSNKAKLVKGLRHNGIRGFDYEREKYWIPAMSNVDLDIEGQLPYNFCLSEIQCAIGNRLLDKIDILTETRIRRFNIIKECFSEYKYPELQFQKYDKSIYKHVHHLLPAKFNSFGSFKRDKFIEIMGEIFGIKVIVQYCPLNRYPLFQKIGYDYANCPITDDLFDNMISFPFHSWMSDSDFNYMLDSIEKTLQIIRKIP
jgi:perosamine synthetase